MSQCELASGHQCIFGSAHPSFHLSITPSIHSSLPLSIHLSIPHSLHPSNYPSLHSFTTPFHPPSIHPPLLHCIHPSIHHPIIPLTNLSLLPELFPSSLCPLPEPSCRPHDSPEVSWSQPQSWLQLGVLYAFLLSLLWAARREILQTCLSDTITFLFPEHPSMLPTAKFIFSSLSVFC